MSEILPDAVTIGRRAVALLWLGLALSMGSSAQAMDEAQLWSALRTPGHFALMRHALAPGTGDPARFRLDDCATQRNLSKGGRRQARRAGAAFRANGITAARVLSSQWCRCRETAELLDLGTVEAEPTLNSFFQAWERGPAQLARLSAVIAGLELTGPVVMVTHQVVVSGLIDVFVSSGEIAVVRRKADGSLALLGRIAPQSAE